MMDWLRFRRLTAGDVVVLLAGAVLVWALAAPSLRHRGFERRVQEAADVAETIRSAAEGQLFTSDAWPASASPGEMPPEVRGAFQGRADLSYDGFSAEWRSWEVVDSVPAQIAIIASPDPEAETDAPPDTAAIPMQPDVRQIGAVSIHSGEATLLAALLQRFGSDRSFVYDTVWTLVLPTRAGSR